MLAIVSAGRSKEGFLARADGLSEHAEVLGAIGLVLGALSAAAAVFPLLGSAKLHKAQFLSHLIYFGYLRHWDPADLSTRLATVTADDEVEMLGRQLVAMSERNWTKHRLVQISLILTMTGVVGITLAVATVGR